VGLILVKLPVQRGRHPDQNEQVTRRVRNCCAVFAACGCYFIEVALTDTELLRQYLDQKSEQAFSELAGRHIDLVYSAALRQVRGDQELARDVTQAVFTDLARKARSLVRHPSLPGWLYTSTRYLAAKARRAEQRRRARELELLSMEIDNASLAPEVFWDDLKNVLDDAMHDLREEDRQALLLRFFQRHSLAEVGAQLGLSENTARMRVSRALHKLRGALERRGISSSAAALSALLTREAVSSAPAGIAGSVTQGAMAGAGLTLGVITFGILMATTKTKIAVGALVLMGLLVSLAWRPWIGEPETAREREPVPLAAGEASAPESGGIPGEAQMLRATAMAESPAAEEPDPMLRFRVLDDLGEPIPGGGVNYRRWQQSRFQGGDLVTGDDGMALVPHPVDTTWLQVTTRIDGFADTRLEWRPDRGDNIPETYTVRLERGLRIGGRVVDADGQPVERAQVGWNHEESPGETYQNQSHLFGWIATLTDEEGRWSLDRIAQPMLDRIYGGARHDEHAPSPMVKVGRDPEVARELREGSHLFQLGRAYAVHGIALDPEGNPIPHARILVGRRGYVGSRTGEAEFDGRFFIKGCRAGNSSLTAEAEGFASTTISVEVTAEMPFIEVVLHPGRPLRVRIVNRQGDPIPEARAWLNTMSSRTDDDLQPQASVRLQSDSEGRIVWENAPDQELSFGFHATGYMRLHEVKLHPGEEEHRVTLARGVTIAGTVRDNQTGELIPRFRIVTGYPARVSGGTVSRWSGLERFTINFSGGEFRHTFEEPVIGGMANPGYLLKFEAEGYAPAVSETIGADEETVHLDVLLEPAASLEVVVLSSSGQPAGQAQVALIEDGAFFTVFPGRLEGPMRTSLLRIANDGTFRLPPDQGIHQVAAAHPSGFALAAADDLRAAPVLVLGPWARIEGQALREGGPAAGIDLALQFQHILPAGGLRLDMSSYTVTSDSEGRFRFEQVPPGLLNVSLRIEEVLSFGAAAKGSRTWTFHSLLPIEVAAGETARIEVETPPEPGRSFSGDLDRVR
jgi:RNA polymerase sigma factor (sigma-70 family)